MSQQSVKSFFRDTAMTDGNHRSMVKPETTSHLTYRIIHRRLIEAAKKPLRQAAQTGVDVQAIVDTLMQAHQRELASMQKELERSHQRHRFKGKDLPPELIALIVDGNRSGPK